MLELILAIQVIIVLLFLTKKDKIITIKEPYVMYDFKERQEVIKISEQELNTVSTDKQVNKFVDFSYITNDDERDFMSEKVNEEGMKIKAAIKAWNDGGETY